MAADEGSDLERYSESYCWELLQDIEHGGAADLSPEELKDFRILNAELEKQASQQRFLAVGPGPLGQLVEREPIGKEELAYVNARAQRCADHLNSFCQLDPPLDTAHAPRISVAASGGGYRAMLGTVGFVNCAQQIGLYDGITYIAGLSGSTWAISTAYDKLQKGEESWDKGPWMESVATHLLSSLTEGAYLRAALRAILHAKKQGRRFNLVDLYGLLFHMKLGSGKSKPAAWVTLDELRVGLDASNPTVPYPICTCITQEGDRWVEMTPHRIGFSREKFFIPTRNFGMKFERGKSVSGENEPLYFLEGIWGSAFAANYAAALAYLPKMKSGVAKAILRLALKATLKATAPLRVARVPNFVKGTEFAELAQAERISVLDAGGGTPPTSFNLALPPLVEIPEREVDIIIVLEMSEGCSKPDGDAELWKSSQYFNGQRFPAGLTNPLPPQPGDLPFRVLKPQDQGPWIFYLPIRCKPSEFDLDTELDTPKFEYTADIVNRYWKLVNDLLVASSEGLKATIREKWQEKIAAAPV